MRIAALVLTLAVATIGCRRSVTIATSTTAITPDTLIPGLLIRSSGNWSTHHSKGSKTLEVTATGSTVNWTITQEEKLPGGSSTSGSGSSGITLSSPTDPWFVYVESAEELWFFNGSTELTYNSSKNGGSRSGPAIHAGKLFPIEEKIPTGLIPHLPPDLQKLFPPEQPKEKRPSL